MIIKELNNLSKEEVKTELYRCCGSSTWIKKMVEKHPFNNKQELFNFAEKIWHECSKPDWLEAFSQHPKIGDFKSLEKKFAATKELAGTEQAGIHHAAPEILRELANSNRIYEEKFGFIFIVYATGKNAGEMLSLLKKRLKNDFETEIKIAMEEQNKITRIRLEKLLTNNQ